VLPLIVLGGAFLVVVIVAFAARGRPPGMRRSGWLVVPLVVAVGLAGGLVALFGSVLIDAARRVLNAELTAGSQFGLESYWTYVIAVAAAIAAALVAYLGVDAFPGFVARLKTIRRRGPVVRSRAADTTRLVVLGVAAVGVLVTAGVMEAQIQPRGTGTSGMLNVVERIPLDGSPTGIAMRNDREGYLTMGEGSIVRFVLADDRRSITADTVAETLSFPRGATVVEDRLFVVDIGEVPCETAFPQCWFSEAADELDFVNGSSASLLSFPIKADGTLGDPTRILENLPVVNTEHAPNGLVLGHDGFLYLSVGGVDRMPQEPQLLERISHPNREWLGTVLRLRPDGGEVEVFARGIRNVFDLAVSPAGNLYGADNDGVAVRGLWLEQLYELREGANYGYPEFATLDGRLESRAAPITVLAQAGSSAILWAEDAGLPRGVLIGALRSLTWVPLQVDPEGTFVADERVQVPLVEVDGFLTGLDATPSQDILATVFSARSGSAGSLIVLRAR
jgi:glucose/arabinose dehydrogenase